MEKITAHLVYLFITAVLLVSHPANADEAKDLYAKGVASFEASRFEEAAQLFQAAYAIKPHWKLLFNIGQALAAAKNYGEALASFEKYLAQGGDEIAEGRTAEVMKELERLRKLLGYVRIVAPDGAAIEIDGKLRGNAPISAEIPLSIGVEHTVVMIENGQRTEKKVSVRAEVSQEVSFVEEAGTAEPVRVAPVGAPKSAPTAPTPPPKDDRHRKLKTAGWVTAGTGAAILIAAGVVGGIALSMDKDLESQCTDSTCTGDDRDEADKMKKMGIAADVMFGVGGVALVTGVVLVIAGTKKRRASESSVSVSPVMSSSFSGAVLKGAF